ncbi:unnamed protein product [Diatraea saccharalis]|uniref:Fibronectin type-III domain-containing protein n=1 Tax=Diatraea saccharalis TaxID=40085 RepID=A0A9N9WKM5_9NEOP|nr:unnamed protein product [Diatraea saccharalis]
MQWLCFLLMVAVSYASVPTTRLVKKTDGVIPSPVLISLTAIDPTGFKLRWQPIKGAIANSILGYKVKIWEQPLEKVYKYETLNGVKVLVEKYTTAKFPLESQVPGFEPVNVILTQADEREAIGQNLRVGLIYEFRVQAFTNDGDGPLSAPMRLKFSLPGGVQGHAKESTLSNTSDSN